MDQRFLDEAVCRKPELFRAMVDFNSSRMAQAGQKPMPAPDTLGNALLSDPLIRKALGRTSEPGTADCWWDFSDETFRLLLIEDSTLERASLGFSAAVYAEELALVIDRAQVLALRRLLGEDIFTYALRRGRYQIGSLRPFLTGQIAGGTLAERISLLASSILICLADGWPEQLQRLWTAKLRASGMLSEAAGSGTALPPLSREQRRALWFTFKKLLLREAAPQWAPCFD